MNLLPEFPYKSFIFTAILNSHNELGPPLQELDSIHSQCFCCRHSNESCKVFWFESLRAACCFHTYGGRKRPQKIMSQPDVSCRVVPAYFIVNLCAGALETFWPPVRSMLKRSAQCLGSFRFASLKVKVMRFTVRLAFSALALCVGQKSFESQPFCRPLYIQ